jgi:hypothetical protein
MTGSFTQFEDASVRRREMVSAGFDGAFVVAYENGTRIPTSEARKKASN